MTTITRSKPTTRETWTRRTPTGDILALSSDGSTIYRVTLAPDACECPGYQFRHTCRHLDAARARYADLQPCRICGHLTTGREYRHVGGADDLELALCHVGEGHCA